MSIMLCAYSLCIDLSMDLNGFVVFYCLLDLS